MCRYGQGVVCGLFEEFDVGSLKGFAVWLPIMSRDNVESAREEAMTFRQFPVSHVWDPERQLGHLYGKMVNLIRVAWDMYFVYAPGVRWEGVELPQPAFWMHQLPASIGAGEELLLNPSRILREILKLLGDGARPSSADLGFILHGKGLENVIKERNQYSVDDVRQAVENSKTET